MFRAFLVALQFLTRLPVRLGAAPTPEQRGRSLLFYPVVGALIGLLLWGLARLSAGADPLLAAALLLAAWVALTGALHIDGLADSADAWLGGGDAQRTLAIMKDPRSGPAGVAAVVLTLLVKCAALAALLRTGAWPALLVAPVIARTAVIGLFLTTHYVRAEGLGSDLARHLPSGPGWLVVALVAIALPALCGYRGLRMLLAAVAAGWLLRRLMVRRIGGTTGDTAGALIEVVEAVCLVALAL